MATSRQSSGAAERLMQTFKQALKKSDQPPRQALQEFLIQYRRTPTSNGFSPSEMLNGRQIRTKIDTLLLSPAHIAQGKQAKEATRSQEKEDVALATPSFKMGVPVHALYFGPRQDREPRWVRESLAHVRRSFQMIQLSYLAENYKSLSRMRLKVVMGTNSTLHPVVVHFKKEGQITSSYLCFISDAFNHDTAVV